MVRHFFGLGYYKSSITKVIEDFFVPNSTFMILQTGIKPIKIITIEH
ncbi:Uncharacterised protein [Elizabethkingia meningoseptica]|nr:Uncharacterised protein [Elizabethkingia meningoseptica]